MNSDVESTYTITCFYSFLVGYLRSLAGLTDPQQFSLTTLLDLTENLLFKKKIFNEQFVKNFFNLFVVFLGICENDERMSLTLLVVLKHFLTV